jgi:virginiamycin B lyase
MPRLIHNTLAGTAIVAIAAATVVSQTPVQQAPAGPGGAGRGRGQTVTLPDGASREFVQAMCASCHPLTMITSSAGYDRQGWHDLISTMVRLPEAQNASVSEYLAANFPPKPGRRPTLVAGDTHITIKEWIAPTLGQRVRDPLQSDQTIYWTGMFASLVGQLDPKTGEMREYKLPQGTQPHSIINDRDGMIWFTGNGNATVGRLDPKTGDIRTHQMPDPAARDPHTPIFDHDGLLWFTLQNSNMIGRLTPATGEIKLITVPTPNARPYGIIVNSQGLLWVAYNGSNGIASIDPKTMELKEYRTPNAATRIRRLDVLKDDTIFYGDWRGFLGRFDPKTGAFKEWPSPSGDTSQPYALVVVDDIVWYNESGQRPDALVRFDPKTEKFQSWAVPSGYGIIRHMRRTPDGNIVFHQSSSNRVGLITIAKDPASGRPPG